MDTLFFIASKLVWALIRPSTWIVIGLGLTALALVRGRLRPARRWALLTFVFAVAMAALPLGDLAIRPLEARHPPGPPLTSVDGIVVLGGSEEPQIATLWGAPQLNDAAERYTGAAALARRFPEARVLHSGGSGRLRDAFGIETPETSVARAFYAGAGLSPDRLIFEEDSRNTAENAAFSLALAGPRPGETWVLVTSAFHMPRALRSFRRAGWTEIVPYPVDHRSRPFAEGLEWHMAQNLHTLELAIKEYVGLVVYGVTGR